MNKPINKRTFGAIGEQEAARYLMAQGYTILARNFRVGRMGEIDLIAREGRDGKNSGTLCFIEVKTRSSNRYGTPSEAVFALKQATITRVAQVFMQRHGYHDTPVRFDIVELWMDHEGKTTDIQLIKNAF